MLCKRIIVCLDVRDGEVVKGVRFVDLRQVGDPAELAARYQREGADEVVFLDISASHEGRKTMHEVVRRTAEQLFVPLTVGGGIDSVDDIGLALRAGADKVSINTAAVCNPALLEEAAERFGRQCIVASIDARLERDRPTAGERGGARPTPVAGGPGAVAGGPAATTGGRAPVASGYRVYTHGGRTPTDLDAVAWARECAARGAGEILLTAIDRDGGRDGYDLELTRMVVDAVSVPVVASGGAGDAAHLRDAFLIGGADAALAAGIFHDRVVSVGEVKRVLAGAGLPVRIQEEAA
jgi:cyclase